MAGMSHLEIPRFPRGFVLSDRPVAPPPGFTSGPLLENFWIHPWLNIQTAGNRDLFVIVVGHCVPTSPSQPLDPATALLAALREGEGLFFETLSAYSGRHAVIFGQVGNLSVVNDATGMKSVFYAARGGVIASHALLVERALGGQIVESELPYRYGYPGNRTPYSRTKILTPNTYYWMTANVVRRFWPITSPQPVSVEEAAYKLLESSSHALQTLARGRTVRVTLTAGLDSRAVLAIALHSGVKFETYTYGNTYASKRDRQIGKELATQFGIKHTIIDTPIPNPTMDQRLVEAHPTPHHGSWVYALCHYFEDIDDAAVLGNSLEIGRSNYTPQRDNEAPAPVDAVSMAGLHHRKVGKAVLGAIEEFGEDRFWELSEAAFRGFIHDTGYESTVGLLDPFDQFYWEHRMGTWQSVAMGERDFYGVSFIPYNSRRIFETLLGAPFASRREDAAVLRMLDLVDPSLLELPVNPRRWPARQLVQSMAR